MKMLFLSAPLALALAACATTPPPVTAEERARCQHMASEMGTAPQHDHSEVKNVTGRSPMNRAHDRCREVLRSGG
jgi:hypothetical protein